MLIILQFFVHSGAIEKDDQCDHNKPLLSDGLHVGKVKFAWIFLSAFDVWTSTYIQDLFLTRALCKTVERLHKRGQTCKINP